MSLVVEATGPLALVQDLGRPGLAALGVTRSGAADRGSADCANRAAGNRPDAAVLEILAGGLALRATADHVVALAGAHGSATVTTPTGVRRLASPDVVRLPAGAVLRLGAPTRGLRTYVAVAGGVRARSVLGSRSRDTLAGLGPEPLAVGDVLPVGTPHGEPAPGWVAGVQAAPPGPAHTTILDVVAGPREDHVTAGAWGILADGLVVRPDSDRVGIRVSPPGPLRHTRGTELPSEPTVRGAVQVPPDGNPVIFGPDHPVTGGYPVVGVLTPAAADRLAQLAPGARFGLRRVAAPA